MKEYRIMNIVTKFYAVSVLLAATCICQAQNKLTRNQILNVVRTHQQNVDSLQVAVGDSVVCDSTTTKIALEVFNDTIGHKFNYRLTFSMDEIIVDVFNSESNLYRSAFEYDKSSFDKLKEKINKSNLRKVDSCDDDISTKENDVLRLYRGNKCYMSVESYNGRTNVTTGFHDLVKEIKKLIPDISSVFSMCDEYEGMTDSVLLDTASISLVLSEESVKFKSKGGEFKKIKITSNTDDWEVLECPEWISYSRNKNNEIIIESSKNDTKNERKGIIKIGCLGEVAEIVVTQM